MQGLLAEPPTPKDGSDPQPNELRDFLMNPLQSEARKELVDTMTKEYSLQEASQNLLKVLIDNNRLECLPEIAAKYEQEFNENSETKVPPTWLFMAFPGPCIRLPLLCTHLPVCVGRHKGLACPSCAGVRCCSGSSVVRHVQLARADTQP